MIEINPEIQIVCSHCKGPVYISNHVKQSVE